MTVTPVSISNARLAAAPLEHDLGADPEGWISSLGGPSLPLPWFVYESPRGECLVGSGRAARLAASGPDRFEAASRWLRNAASTALAEGVHDTPIAVGAFGFSDGPVGAAEPRTGTGGLLWIPSTLLRREADGRVRASAWRGTDAEPPRAGGSLSTSWIEGERTAWIEGVEAALRRIAAGSLEKVVLARARVLAQHTPYDPLASFLELRARYPECHRYLLRLEDGTAFLGASPERLVSLRGRALDADAVAGTARIEKDGEEAAARRLLESSKERNEHAIVAREIVAALRLRGARVEVEPSPSAFRLRHVLHLRSRIEGIVPEGVGVLDLVRAIHPSPAVLGTPREAALEMIEEWEPRDRGWYAGPVGWMGGDGDGEFTLGLRSALLDGPRALLQAGAGIVTGSDPEREWHECEAKMRFVAEVLRG